MNIYTSLELNKQLSEWGCELESELILQTLHNKEWTLVRSKDIKELNDYEKTVRENFIRESNMKVYPAYDILNDICVKYAKEFFGTKDGKWTFQKWESVSTMVFLLIRNWKKKMAEDYILEHTIFNPNNK